ncbi:MAG: hypothetical protein K6G72_06870 [Lachnospiraceae bacterium]|nr:hypothetical protein [Lachnospiraceae bacterium]
MGENNSSDSSEKRTYTYSPVAELYALAEVSPNAPKNAVVKWYNVKMSYEDKYRFGHITYEEYCAWMYELMNSQSEVSSSPKASDAPPQAYNSSSAGETFWHEDHQERTNISQNDYSDFLASNSVDVSNRNTVDFDKLASEVNSGANSAAASAPVAETPPPAASEDVDVNEVLANVNKDMHGGDAVLSPEEIAALFAAANGET